MVFSHAGLGLTGGLDPATVAEIRAGGIAPRRFANDAGTVAVWSLLGKVTRLEGDPAWVSRSSDAMVSEEYARIALEAARETDRSGRSRSEGE